MAEAIAASGMQQAGYTYIVLDDSWSATKRDADGNLVAHPKKFPSGMKALGDWLHSKGLKFGIYNCAGTKTCRRLPRRGRPRRAGRPHVRLVGRRLFEIRLVQHRGPRPEGAIHEDAQCAARRRPARGVQHVRVGPEQTLAVGRGHRPSLADHRRHHRLLGLQEAVEHVGSKISSTPRSASKGSPGPAIGTIPTCSKSVIPGSRSPNRGPISACGACWPHR